MKKVCHFVRKSTQLKASFIHNQIMNHIEYSPIVIALNESYSGGGFVEDSLEHKCIRHRSNKLSNLLPLNGIEYHMISSYLKEHDVSILHYHYGTDAGLFAKTLRKLGIPSVVSFYGYECSGFPKRFLGLGKVYLQKHVFPFVDYVLAMSADMAGDIEKTGCPGDKILVHYHGIPSGTFIKKRDSCNAEYVRFSMISGFTPQKGHMFLLEAFKHAHKRVGNIKLSIYGSGIMQEQIERYVKRNDMGGYVSLIGPVKYGSEQHIRAFECTDVFIHPSVTDINGDKEGIPGAIVEAMAFGLPVISTNHAGIPEVIENGVSGYLVNEWDVDSLSDAIVDLAVDNEKRQSFGIEALHKAATCLDISVRQSCLEYIYSKLTVK